ncbi:MAG: hypothetical protein RR576_01400 [Oscillospiraceae bacterium]
MKLSELMKGFTPSPNFKGVATAEDYILAVDFSGTAAKPNDYLVAQEGITEHSGSLNPQTKDNQFIRGGMQTRKTGNQRSFKLAGAIYIGDEFQDALNAHTLKYGQGEAVIKKYVYFNMLTGKGEQGKVSIMVEDDPSGTAGENAGVSATLSAIGTPTEYIYTAAPSTP